MQREKVLHVNGLLGPFLCRTWGPWMRVLHAYGLLGPILCMTRGSQMRVLHGNSALGPILCTTFSRRGEATNAILARCGRLTFSGRGSKRHQGAARQRELSRPEEAADAVKARQGR